MLNLQRKKLIRRKALVIVAGDTVPYLVRNERVGGRDEGR